MNVIMYFFLKSYISKFNTVNSDKHSLQLAVDRLHVRKREWSNGDAWITTLNDYDTRIDYIELLLVCFKHRVTDYLRCSYDEAMPMTIPMGREAAMALYGERRRRTALVYLDRAGGMYRRSDVMSMLETTVGLRKVEAVGQLQNLLHV